MKHIIGIALVALLGCGGSAGTSDALQTDLGTDTGQVDAGLEDSPKVDPGLADDGQVDSCCVPDCDWKQCGPDGCGGDCGECLVGEICDATGQCVCAQDCTGKECGDDGCGGSCGPCQDGKTCVDGECWTPQCQAGMCLVPAGKFMMGMNSDVEPGVDCNPTYNHECPYHSVNLPEFKVDRLEVTNEQYAQFLNSKGDNQCDGVPCFDEVFPDARISQTDGVWFADVGTEQAPAGAVTWFGAKAYCEGRCPTCRLCSESEWEKAARGTDGRRFPWGNELATCEYAVMRDIDLGIGCGTGWTWPVGAKPHGVSPYGALDMAGNAMEWIQDWYHKSYSCCGGAPIDGSAWEYPVEIRRVVRGGDTTAHAGQLRTSYRAQYLPSAVSFFIGFRCCATL